MTLGDLKVLTNMVLFAIKDECEVDEIESCIIELNKAFSEYKKIHTGNSIITDTFDNWILK